MKASLDQQIKIVDNVVSYGYSVSHAAMVLRYMSEGYDYGSALQRMHNEFCVVKEEDHKQPCGWVYRNYNYDPIFL